MRQSPANNPEVGEAGESEIDFYCCSELSRIRGPRLIKGEAIALP